MRMFRIMSSSGSCGVAKAMGKPKFTTNVGPNDILLGRGAPIINNVGNVRFRQLVTARKKRYLASARHQEKNEIANEIINIIYQRGGQFLRKAENNEEMTRLGITSDMDAWIPVDDSAVILKVKQALRENENRYQGSVRLEIQAADESKPNASSLNLTKEKMPSPLRQVKPEVSDAAAPLLGLSAISPLPSMDTNSQMVTKLIREYLERERLISYIQTQMRPSQVLGDQPSFQERYQSFPPRAHPIYDNALQSLNLRQMLGHNLMQRPVGGLPLHESMNSVQPLGDTLVEQRNILLESFARPQLTLPNRTTESSVLLSLLRNNNSNDGLLGQMHAHTGMLQPSPNWNSAVLSVVKNETNEFKTERDMDTGRTKRKHDGKDDHNAMNSDSSPSKNEAINKRKKDRSL